MNGQNRFAIGMILLFSQCCSAASLSDKTLQRIENEVIPAWEMGDTVKLLHVLSRISQKLDADQLDAFDSELAAQGIPPTVDLLTNSRMAMLQQGITDLPPVHQREVLLAIPFLRDAVESTLESVASHSTMQDPITVPKSLDGFERLFWEIHVFENQIQTAFNVCEYGAMLVKHGGRSRVDRLPESDRDLLDTNFGLRAERLKNIRNELTERKLELRLERLDRAEKVLATSTKFVEQLQAAHVANLDGSLLAEALRGDANRWQREKLRVEGLADKVSAKSRKIGDEFPELTTKGRQFFVGLHWWLRGRFGSGPDGGGLLKHPAAIHNDAALFGLFMPAGFEPPPVEQPRTRFVQEQVPQSDDADLGAAQEPVPEERNVVANGQNSPPDGTYVQDEAIQPDFKRRHHYHWLYEYRKVSTSAQWGTHVESESKLLRTATRTKLTRFY